MKTRCPDCGKSVPLKLDGSPTRHWSNGIRCTPHDDPDIAYDGGWVRDGLILRPAVRAS